MSLPGLFPIYPDPIPMLYQVSLGLPALPTSEISKSIGIEGSAGFLIPNIDFLNSFAQGNLGIADKITKETLYKNFNNSISQSNEKAIKRYAKNNGIDIPDFDKYKVDGKIKFPKEDVTVPNMGDVGLKAFEKTIMTSIFETQKPYLEVVKLVIGNVAKIEDIIARSMPLLGVPLVTKSLKPVVNNGSTNRPKAIGYQNGDDLKKALSKLKTLSNDGSKVKIDKNGNATRDLTPLGTASFSGSTGNSNNSNWEVISTVYSTGQYIPGVEYRYTYIDLPDKKKKADENEDLNLDDDDPYNKYKPERIILGVFRADGTPLNPNEKLTTIGINGNNVVYNTTPFPRAEWILKSPKWNLSNVYSWPAFDSPIYKWSKNILTEDSKTSPGEGWEIKKYKEGDKNLLTNNEAIKGDPIIVGFDSNQLNEYKSYFTDTVRYKMNQVEDLDQSEKNKYTNEIVNQLDISAHLQNVFLYGQNKSVYKNVNGNPAFPNQLKINFKPFQIFSANAEKDEKLTSYNKAYGQQPGFIWIDPESDYETKVIRVDPTTNIAFEDAKGQPQASTIKSFVKNRLIFNISNGQSFNIDISKNGLKVKSYKNVYEYVIENWNYNSDTDLPPDKRINNINNYNVSIWSDNSLIKYNGIYDKNNLPNFGTERIVTINYDGDLNKNTGNLPVSIIDKQIPLYQIKAESADFLYGKIIDPSKITNENLTKDELFSKGKYGVGNADNPQEIEVIQRYMLTDTDTESYYIIEGILVDKNKQTDSAENGRGSGNSTGNEYYRIPHALGATKVFLSLVVDIVSKLIPQILKLIALFKNPSSFVIDIIKEKLGDGFSIFSKESFNTFEKAKSIKDNKNSDKVNKIKDTFKNSPLFNTVFVDKNGNYKFLLDGLAMIPFEIFGANLPFGAELNFNLPNSPIKLIMDSKLSKVKNMQDFLMPKIKDFKSPGSNVDKNSPMLNISDIKKMESPIYKSNYKIKNDTDLVDIKYSTGEFISGVNYNYIYINQDVNIILTDANIILNTPNESVDIDKAKKTSEDLNDALKKDPTNTVLKDVISKLKSKLGNLADNTQPLIKMLLGMVTIPIKIIGGIIEWLMNFFKGLTNPLTLPAKISELLSFSWIMDIMSPIGLMKLIGINFKPDKLVEWASISKAKNNKGKFLIPDDHELADLNEFFSAPFISKLPTYTARQFRENYTRPLKLVLPILCFLEKIINGIIDFIWSTLGIEALIPPPHIKLCSNSVDPDINDAIKLANDMNKSSESLKIGGTFSNGKNGSVPTDSDFLYDITLDNVVVVKGLNYEQMQKYVKDHENIGYDFKF